MGEKAGDGGLTELSGKLKGLLGRKREDAVLEPEELPSPEPEAPASTAEELVPGRWQAGTAEAEEPLRQRQLWSRNFRRRNRRRRFRKHR